MTIVCEVSACPYNKNRFCRNRLIYINGNGACDRLTKSNWREPVDKKFMEGYKKC